MRHYKKGRQEKQLRLQGIIPAQSAVHDRRDKLRRKKKYGIQQQPSNPQPKRRVKRRMGYCETCDRMAFMSNHHLIPISRARLYTKKIKIPKAKLCKPCHAMVHIIFSNVQLETDYNTVAKLRGHPKVISFIKWVRANNPDSRLVGN